MLSLGNYFRSQAEWRRQKAEEYPDDRRNAQSAAALESLAEFVEQDFHEDDRAIAGVVARLDECHLFEGFILGGEEAARSVSRYGFGYPAGPASHADFLEALELDCLEDAYEGVRDRRWEGVSHEPGAEDPTGALLPFEVDAGKAGVVLPRYYFERRPGWTEPELEEAVAAYVAEQVES